MRSEGCARGAAGPFTRKLPRHSRPTGIARSVARDARTARGRGTGGLVHPEGPLSGHHTAVEITAVRQVERDNDAVTLVVSYPFDDIETGALLWEPDEDAEIYDVVESRQGTFSAMFPPS